MSEVILMAAVIGMVSATARVLYQHPIRWSEEPASGSGHAAESSVTDAFASGT